jgi:type I site-specific restriction endonuclease
MLRKYQIETIEAFEQSDEKNILLQMPTGAGKTFTFTEIAKRFFITEVKKVLIVVHRNELLTQYVEGTQTASGCIKEFDGYHLFTGISNKRKNEIINSMIKRYNLTEMTCDVVQVN